MFDIGWGELVLIGLVALIVVGPKELPTVLRAAGQWVGKAKRMASEFQGQFQEALREAEVSDLKEHAESLTGELKSLTEYDPLADLDKDDNKKDESGESDWDELSYEAPTHEETQAEISEHVETPAHEEPAAEPAHEAIHDAATDSEKTADGGEPVAAEPVAAPIAEPVTETERMPAAPVAAVETAPIENAEHLTSSETPPPKQAGGAA